MGQASVAAGCTATGGMDAVIDGSGGPSGGSG